MDRIEHMSPVLSASWPTLGPKILCGPSALRPCPDRAPPLHDQPAALIGFCLALTFETRSAEGKFDRLSALAQELVRRQVTVIAVVGGGSPVRAAKLATTTIPIVFAYSGDPIEDGIVTNLNRPGGNITGATFFTYALGPKRLEMLHELVPKVSSQTQII